jgi:AAA+ superfamily predicted ATPase
VMLIQIHHISLFERQVNAHSLFSKWFSESGKLVNKLFATIQELVDDPECFVVVLIDEVESLTAARKSALSGNEPSDAIRVVNALLTQIDQLKQFKNVMVMTTSNITEAIDLAFVDRADIKQYIGLPSAVARYQILQSCMMELMRVGVITPPVPLKVFAPTTATSHPQQHLASSLQISIHIACPRGPQPPFYLACLLRLVLCLACPMQSRLWLWLWLWL